MRNVKNVYLYVKRNFVYGIICWGIRNVVSFRDLNKVKKYIVIVDIFK